MPKINIYYGNKIKTIETDISLLKTISSLEEELLLPKMDEIKDENDEVNITILQYGDKIIIKYNKPTLQDETSMFFNEQAITPTPLKTPKDASFVGTLRPSSKKIKIP